MAFTYPDNWNNLSIDEKMDARFASYKSTRDIEFISKEVEEKYRKRAQRLEDVIKLKKPNRVPIDVRPGYYPAHYTGITAREVMYDYDKAYQAFKRFNEEFDIDYIVSPGKVGSGPLLELMDYKVYNWAGHGTGENISYQCIEREYMKEDEYDDLINDPSDYFIRRYFPRIFGILKSWEKLSLFTSFIELPFVGSSMVPAGMPEVQKAFKTFMEAGQEAYKWSQMLGKFKQEIQFTQGLPSNSGGYSKAPFDTLGDTLRGTSDIMLDIYRRPEKILEAVEKLVPIHVKMGINAANRSNMPFVKIPLHKGEDSFMSREHFLQFYWPTLKKVILGLIEDGCVPSLFVEGAYNNRLDFLADDDLPEGKICWMFDKTDMAEAHKYLAGKAAIGGNVPTSLFTAGTPGKIEEYVKNLIKEVAGDGGFILSPGANFEHGKEENIRAYIKAGKKYGKY